MATSTYGTPYVQGSDLVSAYPTTSSSLATRVDEVSYRGNGLNAQTGTTYTLVAGDAGKTITLSNASPVTVTLPQDSTADLPDGAVVTFYNLGAGTVTISQGTGATLQGGSIVLAQFDVTSVIKLSANTYGKFDGAGNSGLKMCVPTSIANSGGTATLSVNTTTFTNVTSISLNGVFTSDYNYHRVVIEHVSNSGTPNLRLRFRAAGSDLTGSLYTFDQSYSGGSNRLDNQTSFLFTDTSTEYQNATADITGAAFARFTSVTGVSLRSVSRLAEFFGGVYRSATAVDGITFFPGSGDITGTVSVYGYMK